MSRSFLSMLLGSALALLPLVGSSDEVRHKLEESRTRLARIVADLKAEKEAIQQTRGREKSLLGELETLEQRLAESGQTLEETQRQIGPLEERIPQLADKVATQRQALQRQKEALAAHLRVIYGLGEEGGLKVAFSQESPAQMQQGMHYFSYLLRSRNERFHQFRQELAALHRAMLNHQSSLEQLKTLSQQLADEQEKSRQGREERSRLLAQVRQEQSLQQRKVEELQQAQEALTSFVDRLQGEMAKSIPLPKTDQGHMTANKGKLNTPVAAKGEGKSPGLFFPVVEATPVTTVYRGQVVYADWFRGYGLLLILDHGDHIFTLYGHNRRLLVSQGDWVETGDAIAESGDTGTMDGPAGLYFEIRQKGRAVEPRHWLAANNN